MQSLFFCRYVPWFGIFQPRNSHARTRRRVCAKAAQDCGHGSYRDVAAKHSTEKWHGHTRNEAWEHRWKLLCTCSLCTWRGRRVCQNPPHWKAARSLRRYGPLGMKKKKRGDANICVYIFTFVYTHINCFFFSLICFGQATKTLFDSREITIRQDPALCWTLFPSSSSTPSILLIQKKTFLQAESCQGVAITRYYRQAQASKKKLCWIHEIKTYTFSISFWLSRLSFFPFPLPFASPSPLRINLEKLFEMGSASEEDSDDDQLRIALQLSLEGSLEDGDGPSQADRDSVPASILQSSTWISGSSF